MPKLKDCKTFQDLEDRVEILEGIDELDNQEISLSGNTLTLSGGLVPDSSVDLSQYLDNTDDQQIQAFNLTGDTLTLTLEDGGTQTVNLSTFRDNTDDQVLSLLGNNLSIEDGNTIDLSQYLDNTNAWYTNGTTTVQHNGRTGDIHHNGEVHIGNGTTGSSVIISEANSVATVPDIKFAAQGLVQSESNQFYHSQTGNHQFIGGNTSGTTGSFPIVDFNQTGEVEFNQYGNGTFTGNPAFNLSVDTNGNVIETPIVPPSVGVDATFGLAPVDIHNNGTVVQLTDKILDPGFSRTNNNISYSGNPEKIQIQVSINAFDNGASNYWSRPKLRIIRGGNIIAVFDDLVMQQNGAYDGDATIVGSFLDKQPGANPTYTFEWFDEENRTSTLIPESYSQISLTAQ